MKPNHLLARHSLISAAVLAVSCALAGSAFAQTVNPNYGTVIAKKFYDRNANGVRDVGEPWLANWPMTLTSPDQSTNTKPSTAVWSGLLGGSGYSVLEGTPTQANWWQSAPTDGAGNPINPVDVTVVPCKTVTIKFGNYCQKKSGGRTPGFWSNRNGAATIADGGDSAPELGLLSSLKLVDATGADFDPTSHAELNQWLLDGNAVNMAYMLSVHLAAMTLNIEANFVNDDAFYIPCGCTVGELVADAQAALLADQNTPSGDPNRDTQEDLKDWLDELNNGALVIPPNPCPRTFYTAPVL